MSVVAVRNALEIALAAMSPAVDTAWENANYTPVVGTPYQRVFMLLADPANPEIGTFTQERGYLQISLVYPLGTGPSAADARADLIRNTFKRGDTFTASGVTITIEKTPERSPAIIEPDRYVVPVKIRFFANFTQE